MGACPWTADPTPEQYSSVLVLEKTHEGAPMGASRQRRHDHEHGNHVVGCNQRRGHRLFRCRGEVRQVPTLECLWAARFSNLSETNEYNSKMRMWVDDV